MVHTHPFSFCLPNKKKNGGQLLPIFHTVGKRSRSIKPILKPRPNDRNIVGRNMLRTFGHRVATCCDMLGVVGSSLKMVKFEPTTPNMSQHIATRWPNARNMLPPTMLRYAALACCNRLAGVYIEQVSNPLRYYNFTVSV